MLACPLDGARLDVSGGERAHAGELGEGSLACERGHGYRVEGGVPRMVPQEAPGEPSQATTEDTFSAKWSRVAPEEIEQRFAQQHAWYLERFGFEGDDDLAAFLAGRRHVLEAGTGLGGDAARFARLSGAEVVAIDLSRGIETAQRRFGALPNVHYVQADLMRPPFRPGRFDFVSSDQVIHHTPDARRAFATLASLLAPGGTLAVYVYKRKAPLRELADDWVRARSTRMSVDDCMELSAGITELGRELSRVGATVTLERGVPLLGIEPGEHDVQRLVYWSFLKCFWNESFSENLNTLVNFDWYHPRYASRHTPEQLRSWCGETSLELDHLHVGDSGISVRATRPR